MKMLFECREVTNQLYFADYHDHFYYHHKRASQNGWECILFTFRSLWIQCVTLILKQTFCVIVAFYFNHVATVHRQYQSTITGNATFDRASKQQNQDHIGRGIGCSRDNRYSHCHDNVTKENQCHYDPSQWR